MLAAPINGLEDAISREEEVSARLRELLGEDRAAALAELLRESRTILRQAR